MHRASSFRTPSRLTPFGALALAVLVAAGASCGGSAFQKEDAPSDKGAGGDSSGSDGTGDDHGSNGGASASGSGGRKILRDAGERNDEGDDAVPDGTVLPDAATADTGGDAVDEDDVSTARDASPIQPGECALGSQCASGPCEAVTPGGYTVCLSPPQAVTSCSTGATQGCCSSSNCNDSPCVAGPLRPRCGGPVEVPRNECAVDECTADSDCTGASPKQICLPAGAFGRKIRTCFDAYCKTNTDCPGTSVCAPVARGCCGDPDVLACVPPGGCHEQSDCCRDGGCTSCEVDLTNRKTFCQSTAPVCAQ